MTLKLRKVTFRLLRVRAAQRWDPNMRSVSRPVLLGAAVASAVMALAGCSSSSGSSTATIKVWLGDPVSPQTLPFVQQLASQFEQSHKGVTIQLSLLSDANAHQQYITA